MRRRAGEGEPLDALRDEAFALCLDASERAAGHRLTEAELEAARVLHSGSVAILDGAEAQAYASLPPAFLNSLGAEPVHLVVTDDERARQTSEWLSPAAAALGVTIATVLDSNERESLRPLYAAELVVGSAAQFQFDYLRDGLATSLDECVQRGRSFAILANADRLLVEEANMPPSITVPTEGGRTLARIRQGTYFRLYERLAGTSPSAGAHEQELREAYGLRVVEVSGGGPSPASGHDDEQRERDFEVRKETRPFYEVEEDQAAEMRAFRMELLEGREVADLIPAQFEEDADAMAAYKRRRTEFGQRMEDTNQLERHLLLFAIDERWPGHLADLDALPHDPVLGETDDYFGAYRFEAAKRYKQLWHSIWEEFLHLMNSVEIEVR